MEMVAVHQLEPAKKTFFYEKPSGEIFACGEQEAALFGKNYRQIGVSDGATFRTYMRKAGFKGDVLEREKAQLLLKEAFDAELEVARGHFERPKLNNVHFDESYPEEQRASFVPPR